MHAAEGYLVTELASLVWADVCRHLLVAPAASRLELRGDCEDNSDASSNTLVISSTLMQQAANVAGRITCTVRARYGQTKVMMNASTHAFLVNSEAYHFRTTNWIELIKTRAMNWRVRMLASCRSIDDRGRAQHTIGGCFYNKR
jgi:hypothetical protein